jgi:uncharacterized protein YkwD
MARRSSTTTASTTTVSTDTASPDRPLRDRSRRWRVVAPLVAVVALALGVAACAPPGSPGSGATGDMVSAVNQDRAMAGLPPLAWDQTLYDLARNHANEIAASQSLWHSDVGLWLTLPWMRNWHAMGENLFSGTNINSWNAEDAWMASPLHRANILDPGYNQIGVGVTVDSAGRVWLVTLFGAR